MDLASLHAAYRRIAPHTHRTPLLTSRLLDELLGKRLLLKAEHLQKTGSFKARGALAKALTVESPKGLLAVSSGNHAQGVAYAARVLGVRALLVIPEEASPLKKAAARAYGAEVVDRGVTAENREEVAKALQEETGYALIHPFDDPWVIAGQGTAGLELMVQAGERGVFPEAVLVPVGGGGLIAGVAGEDHHGHRPGGRPLAPGQEGGPSPQGALPGPRLRGQGRGHGGAEEPAWSPGTRSTSTSPGTSTPSPAR
jgi:threo-3-hydroxy-L-aspartate ammonia-lyase